MKYDNRGNVVEIKDPLGNITTFEYDILNRLKAVIEPEGNKTSYEYMECSGQVRHIETIAF